MVTNGFHKRPDVMVGFAVRLFPDGVRADTPSLIAAGARALRSVAPRDRCRSRLRMPGGRLVAPLAP